MKKFLDGFSAVSEKEMVEVNGGEAAFGGGCGEEGLGGGAILPPPPQDPRRRYNDLKKTR